MDQRSFRLTLRSGEQTIEVGRVQRDYRPQVPCDRCGIIDASVSEFTECSTCGTIPLCQDCRDLHIEEIKDGEI